ncbi:Ig-like domain-containing protein [Flavobacterium hauense]
MGITRQYGTMKNGSFRFGPANPSIDLSTVSSKGEFMLTITVNVRDTKGLVAAGEEVYFTVDKHPEWLLIPDVSTHTNSSGNALLTVKGKVSNNAESGYVAFKVANKNNPEQSGSGMIAFTGKQGGRMKRLFFF